MGTPFPTTDPELGNFISPSDHHEGLFTNNERAPRYDNTPTPWNHRIRFMNGSPPKGFSRTSSSNSKGFSRASPRKSQENVRDKILPGVERNLLSRHDQTTSPMYSWKTTADPVTRSTLSFPKEFANDPPNNVQSHKDDRSWNIRSTSDPMDVYRSHTEKRLNTEVNISGGPRWRSDETSDGEEEQGLEKAMDIAYYATPARATRRIRVAKR